MGMVRLDALHGPFFQHAEERVDDGFGIGLQQIILFARYFKGVQSFIAGLRRGWWHEWDE